MTPSTGQVVRSNVRLTFLSAIAAVMIQMVTTIVLARLLEPQDYGLYALNLSVAMLSTSLVAGAIERALVVDRDVSDLYGRTVPIVMLTAAVAVLVIAGAEGLERLADWRIRSDVLAVVLASQVIGSAGIVARVLLRRRLAFSRILVGELAGQALGGGVAAILLAMAGWGAMALAASACVQNGLTFLIVVSGGTMTRDMRFAGFSALLRSALILGRISLLEIANGQIAPLVIGGRLGTVALGLYNRINSLIQLPIQFATTSLTRVLMSALVTVSEDPGRLARAMSQLVRVAAAIITPLAFGLGGSAYAFTATVLGPKWIEAAPLMPFLAVATWSTMVALLFATLAEATRHFRDKVRSQLASSMIAVGLFVAGTFGGVIWVSAAAAASGIVYLLLQARLGQKILGVPARTLFGWVAPGLGGGLLCFAWTTAAQAFIRAEPPLILAAQISGCAVLCLAYYALVTPSLLAEVAAAALPTFIHRHFASSNRQTDG